MRSPVEQSDDPGDVPSNPDLARLRAAHAAGGLATLFAWVRLSGPGWLQSAITLGGGSLASSLYLGVLGGLGFLWLQPLAMLLGIVMLSAIAHVTLVTGERPLVVVRRHVSPVLGYGWVIASLLASMVWCMPQFSLAVGVAQQNLLPTVCGPVSRLGDFGGKVGVTATLLAVSLAVVFLSGGGRKRLFDWILKLMVGAIVVCFVAVVVELAGSDRHFSWEAVRAAFVPDLSSFSSPAAAFLPYLEGLGEEARAWWTDRIVAAQRDVILSAAATAVGINMTFLLPYSLRAKGWTREFSGLVRFDLLTGMFVPFVVTVSCVVLAAASRFHAEPVEGLVEPNEPPAAVRMVRAYEATLQARVQALGGAATPDKLDRNEKLLAAMLVNRDAQDLAQALVPMTGERVAHVVFGLGVLGMALSTITLLMLICGFCVRELGGFADGGLAQRLGCLLGVSGALGPFLWKEAAFYVAVPTSLFGIALLPIAYWTFFVLLNSERALGADRPRGLVRLGWNLAMVPAVGLATVAAAYSIWTGARWAGVAAVAAFLALALLFPPRR